MGLCVTLANASEIEVQILFNSQLQAAHALTPTSRNLAQVEPPCNLRDSSDTHGPVIAFQLGHSQGNDNSPYTILLSLDHSLTSPLN